MKLGRYQEDGQPVDAVRRAATPATAESTSAAPATQSAPHAPGDRASSPAPPSTAPESPPTPVMVIGNRAPNNLRPCGRDAYPNECVGTTRPPAPPPSLFMTSHRYLLIQDLCLLTGGDRAAWIPIPTLSRAFGLELIELIITNYSKLFLTLDEFSFLLKDKLCPLVIKSFRFRVHNLRELHSDEPLTCTIGRVPAHSATSEDSERLCVSLLSPTFYRM